MERLAAMMKTLHLHLRWGAKAQEGEKSVDCCRGRLWDWVGLELGKRHSLGRVTGE